MKENIKIAALITIGLASISAAHASSTDLLLGFNDAAGPSAAQNDYVIDLGLNGNTLIADANGNGGTWNLSSSFNAGTFSTAFSADTAYLNNVAAGVVGGISSPTKTIFQTDLIGNTPAVAFSGQFNNSLSSAQSPTIGEYSSSSGLGWSTYVAIDPNTPGSLSSTTAKDIADQTGNPVGFLSSGSIALALWENTKTGSSTVNGWVDEGTFNIDVQSDTVTFTTTAVPEPGTYGLMAGFGLLAVGLRHQLSNRKA